MDGPFSRTTTALVCIAILRMIRNAAILSQTQTAKKNGSTVTAVIATTSMMRTAKRMIAGVTQVILTQ